MPAMRSHLRTLFRDLRTEGAGAGREAAAIGLGIFIGCLPLFGLHLLMCWTAGWLLRLNRLKLYLAAHVSNPLFAPTLVFVEIQVGAWLRRGALHPLSVDAARTTTPAVFGGDALVGGLIVGSVLGLAMAAATYALSCRSSDDEAFLALVRHATDRYLGTSITAWEFARGKLRGDPIYRALVYDGLLPSGGAVMDLGCGQGLALAILADAERLFRAGQWPAGRPAPPRFDRRVGVERRHRAARIARTALSTDARIVEADLGRLQPDGCQAILLIDVLHMLPPDGQERVIAAAARALQPGGVLVVREADAAAGWRFAMVRAGNWLKAIAALRWRQRFHFRTAADWAACLARLGLRVEVRPMSSRPFANVLVRAGAPPAGTTAGARSSDASAAAS